MPWSSLTSVMGRGSLDRQEGAYICHRIQDEKCPLVKVPKIQLEEEDSRKVLQQNFAMWTKGKKKFLILKCICNQSD